MDENRLCPSVLGDVKGDAVFTYGLRKILRLLGFSIQTRWPRGRPTIKMYFLDHVPCLFRVLANRRKIKISVVSYGNFLLSSSESMFYYPRGSWYIFTIMSQTFSLINSRAALCLSFWPPYFSCSFSTVRERKSDRFCEVRSISRPSAALKNASSLAHFRSSLWMLCIMGCWFVNWIGQEESDFYEQYAGVILLIKRFCGGTDGRDFSCPCGLDLKKIKGFGVFDAGLVAEGRETIKMRLLDRFLWLFGVAGVVV